MSFSLMYRVYAIETALTLSFGKCVKDEVCFIEFVIQPRAVCMVLNLMWFFFLLLFFAVNGVNGGWFIVVICLVNIYNILIRIVG